MEPITVLVADGMKLSNSLAMAFWWFPDLLVLDELPETGPDAVDAIVRLGPNVALVDYSIADMEGPAVAAVVKARAPNTKVIMTAILPSASDIQSSLSAGAVGVLPKSVPVDQVVEAIRRAHSGLSSAEPVQLATFSRLGKDKAAQLSMVRKRMATLTAKEMDVLRLLGFGRTIAEIARELGIGQGTVGLHFHNLVKKTEANSKEQALAMARSCGLIKG